MISYELPMALTIASPLLLSNTLSLREIVNSQTGSIIHWNILRGPFPQIFAFILFVICAFAETNRIPFDLPEAENELVAGFHTEYSSMKFASFFMAEYANMVTVSCMATILFLGGWMPLWPAAYGSNYVPSAIFLLAALALFYHAATAARARDKKTYPIFGVLFLIFAVVFALPMVQSWLIPLFWFFAKTGAILFAFMWIRATLPRFRYDQLMGFAWKFMFPVAMVNLLITALAVALVP
jgi:NADH-quinone oxidoreductase subunit H